MDNDRIDKQFQQLERMITGHFTRMEDRLIALENRVISLESQPGKSPRLNSRVSPLLNTVLSTSFEDSLDYGFSDDEMSSPKHRVKTVNIEPMFKCVQCSKKFREGANPDGSCSYHAGQLKYVNPTKSVFTCCQAPVKDITLAKRFPGCTKGRHRSDYHTDYEFSNYFFHMDSLSANAQEMWLQMDVLDAVTETFEWGEVGLTYEGCVFVLVGYSRKQPLVYRELSFEQLKNSKEPMLELFQRSDPTGWVLRAELQSVNNIAKAITVSLKPAAYKTPLVKRVQLVLTGDSFRPGTVECISDPTPMPPKPASEYNVSEVVVRGPVLEAGEDYSIGRKDDYLTEKSDKSFTIELKQIGPTTAESSLIRLPCGKWNNLFTTTVQITNPSRGTLIKNIYGEYQNKDGEWVNFDQIWVGLKDKKEFFDMKCFPVVKNADMMLTVRTAIAVKGALPGCLEERQRAHYSLPQPLQFRVTFVGVQEVTASLRYEQGNPPLDIVTRKMRESNWNKKRPLPFYLFADDVDSLKRSDAAIYFDKYGTLLYRPSPYGTDGGSLPLTQGLLAAAAHQAIKYKRSEQELTSMKREGYGSSIRVYAMVDLDIGVTYAIKVFITTPTSYATGCYLLPRDDFSSSTISCQPDQVAVNSNTFVTWSIPRATRRDRIGICSKYGCNSITELLNDQGATTGAIQIKAPSIPGTYEVRYYPAWLFTDHSGQQHNRYVVKTSFIVTAH